MVSKPSRRNAYYFILLAGLLAIIWASYRSFGTTSAEKPLSQLLTALDNKQVHSGTFSADGNEVDWVDARGATQRTYIPTGYAGALVERFHQNGLPFDVGPPPSSASLWISTIIPNLVLLLVIGAFMWYMLRQNRQQTRAA